MILEIADLSVTPGRETEFETAFAKARPIIAAVPGFRGLELRRCVEEPARYALLVRWETIEDHTVGFRESEGYGRWKELLHGFYEPVPRVAHYRLVADME